MWDWYIVLNQAYEGACTYCRWETWTGYEGQKDKQLYRQTNERQRWTKEQTIRMQSVINLQRKTSGWTKYQSYSVGKACLGDQNEDVESWSWDTVAL